MKDIALITPVFNPTDIQIDNLFKTYESLKDVVGRFYLGINNKSEKIRDIKEKSNDTTVSLILFPIMVQMMH